jgi:hypothetical protein
MKPPRTQVFAIIRVDKYFADPLEQISVQAVLPSLEEAQAETKRLNGMVDPGKTVYLWRATRYYPEGRLVDGQTGNKPPAS